ncbi:hypothetical protein KP509_13G083400 [Ceratopteris richardii]|nr:hypothetical protein KP509_13G083400 [Ceratopteris richardii]
MVAAYDLIEQFCNTIISRIVALEKERSCPADMKESVASIIYAAPRCTELTELPAIKDAFIAKYGRSFGAAASELHPDCGVNRKIIELLSVNPATEDVKLKLMKEICIEYNVEWTPGEALTGSKQSAVDLSEAGLSKANVAALQGGSKHPATSTVGLAEAIIPPASGGQVLFSANSSKASGQKPVVSLGVNSLKAKPSGSHNLSTLAPTEGSTKNSATFVPHASKRNTIHSDVEKEDAKRLQARINQSLVGSGSSTLDDEDAKREYARIMQSLNGVNSLSLDSDDLDQKEKEPSDSHELLNDSDTDTYVSVDEDPIDDDADLSHTIPETSHENISLRMESKTNLQLQSSHEDIPLGVTSVHQLTTGSSHGEISHRATSKSSSMKDEVDEEDHEEDKASRKSLSINSSQKNIFTNVNSTGKRLEEEHKVKKDNNAAIFKHTDMRSNSEDDTLPHDSLHEDVALRVNSKKSSYFGSLHEDKLPKASSKRGSHAEAVFEGKDSFKNVLDDGCSKMDLLSPMLEDERRNNSLNGRRLPRVQSLEESKDDKITQEIADESSVGLADEKVAERVPSPRDDSFAPSTGKLPEIHSLTVSTSAVKLGDKANQEVRIMEEKVTRVLKGTEYPDKVHTEEMAGMLSKEVTQKNEEPSDFNDKLEEFNYKPVPTPDIVFDDRKSGLDSMPALGNTVEELVASSALGALANLESNQDFAAAAKIIAEEAARLAVLNLLGKQSTEASATPLDHGQLFKYGSFGSQMRKEELQVDKVSSKPIVTDGFEGQSDGMGFERGIIKDIETPSNIDDGTIAHAEVSSVPIIDTLASIDDDSLHDLRIIKDGSNALSLVEDEDINPFATNVAAGTEKHIDSVSSKLEEDESSVAVVRPFQINKPGSFGHGDDHLDIFFQSKTDWLPDERPLFDERYAFLKTQPTYTPVFSDNIPKEKAGFEEDMFSKPHFDPISEKQDTLMEKSSGSFKDPVFDDNSFETPIFDEIPESYLDEIEDDHSRGEPASKKSIKSDDIGKLKWESRKPAHSNDYIAVGKQSESSMQTDSRNPMSKRSRPPKKDGKAERDEVGSYVHGKGTRSENLSPDRYMSGKVEDDFFRASSSGLHGRQKIISDENDWESYFPGKGGSLASKSRNKSKTSSDNMSSMQMANPQKAAHKYMDVDDNSDTEDYRISRRPDNERIRKPQEQYMFDDENTELQGKHSASSETGYMNKRTSAASGIFSPQQHQQHQVQKSKQYRGDMDESSMSRPIRSKQSHTDYEQMNQDDELLDYHEKNHHKQQILDDVHMDGLQGKYKKSSEMNDARKRILAGPDTSQHGLGPDQYEEYPGEDLRFRPKQSRQGTRQHSLGPDQYEEYPGENLRFRPKQSRQGQKQHVEEETDVGLIYKSKGQDDAIHGHYKPVVGRKPNSSEWDANENGANVRRSRQHAQTDDLRRKPHFDLGEQLPVGRMTASMSSISSTEIEPDYEDEFDNQVKISAFKQGQQLKKYDDEAESPSYRLNIHYQEQEEKEYEQHSGYGRSRNSEPDYEDEFDNQVKISALKQGQQLQKYDDEAESPSYRLNIHYQEQEEKEYEQHSGYGRSRNSDRFSYGPDKKTNKQVKTSPLMPMSSRHQLQKHTEAAGSPKPMVNVHHQEEKSDEEQFTYKLHNQATSSPMNTLPIRHPRKKNFNKLEAGTSNKSVAHLHDDYDMEQFSNEELDNQNRSSKLLSGKQQLNNHKQMAEILGHDTDADLQEPEGKGEEHSDYSKSENIYRRLSGMQPASHSKGGTYLSEEEGDELTGDEYDKKVHELVEDCHSNPVLMKKGEKPNEVVGTLNLEQQTGESVPLPQYQGKRTGQSNELSSRPSQSHKSEVRLEGSSVKSSHFKNGEQNVGSSFKKEIRPQQNGLDEQQIGSSIEAKQPSTFHHSDPENKGKDGQQTKTATTSQQLPESIVPPIESSISDPLLLATIPPPVKKQVPSVKSESSIPSPSKDTEENLPKGRFKGPSLDTLAANFEALMRAKKGQA